VTDDRVEELGYLVHDVESGHELERNVKAYGAKRRRAAAFKELRAIAEWTATTRRRGLGHWQQ
jgi:hypothetical protein